MTTTKEIFLINSQDVKKFFPIQTTDQKIRFTDVSLFSSTPVDQSEYTAGILLNYYTKSQLLGKVLTDATSCIGGNVWAFAKLVSKVQAVEIDELHSQMLANNMQVLNLESKVQVICDNYLSRYQSLKQDIIFLDPPWGGTDYKIHKSLDMYLKYPDQTLISIENLINNVLSVQCQVLILKVPINYQAEKKLQLGKFPYMSIHKIKTKPDGADLYQIVVLSHIKKISNISPVYASFYRVGYKYIKYT